MSTEAFQSRLRHDPTWLSSIDVQFEADMHNLLNLPDDALPAGIDLASLSAFRNANGMASFYCRHQGCDQANSGFVTSEAREQHELCHMLRLQCQVPYCAWKGIGFKRKGHLISHKRRYHPSLEDSVIPGLGSPQQAPAIDPSTRAGVSNEFSTSNEAFNLDFSELETTDVLENFDFDSFLQNTDGNNGFSFDPGMNFSEALESPSME